MRKEKLVIILTVIIFLIFGVTINTFASSEPTPVTIRTGDTNNTTSSNEATSITPSNSSIPISSAGASSSGSSSSNATTSISPSNSTTIGADNAVNATSSTSSYRNSTTETANTTGDNLPYTGSNYGIVFVIVALAISAIYAYKKVSDYNM